MNSLQSSLKILDARFTKSLSSSVICSKMADASVSARSIISCSVVSLSVTINPLSRSVIPFPLVYR